MSRPGDVPAVDVAIISWNTSRAALRSAGAFVASEDVEARVTLHDTSEPPERATLEREAGPGIELVLAGENMGYRGPPTPLAAAAHHSSASATQM